MSVRAGVNDEINRQLVREKLRQSVPQIILACILPYAAAASSLYAVMVLVPIECAGLVGLIAPSIFASACIVMASRISKASQKHVFISVALTTLVIPAGLLSLLFGLIVLAPIVFGLLCGLLVAPCWGLDRSIAAGGLYGAIVWVLGLIFAISAKLIDSWIVSGVMFWLLVAVVLGVPPLLCIRLALQHDAAERIAAWTNDLCISCGYSLTGLTANTCPECGEPISPPASPPSAQRSAP